MCNGFCAIKLWSKDNKSPDEKFNIRVAVDCIRRKFVANDNPAHPLSTFEKIIQASEAEILPYLGKVMPELHRIVRNDAVFYRTYPLLYQKFGNMVIFRPGNLYSLCSSGNQHYQKIIFCLMFSSKKVEIGDQS